MASGLPSVKELAAAVARHSAGTADDSEGVLAAASVHPLEEEHTNSVWFGETDRGPVAVKVFAGQQADGADREWRFLNLFANALPGRSPTPFFFDSDDSVIVMEKVPGDPLAGSVLSGQQIQSIAEWLTDAGPCGGEHPDLPLARTAPALLVPRTHLMWQLARTVRTDDPIVDDAVAAGTKWMESGELETLLTLPCEAVSRGDVNLANCLWDGGTVRMIDFEDAGLNNRVVEIGDYTEHIRARRNGEEVWDQLIAAVRATPDDLRVLKVVRRRFALFWLMMLLPGGRGVARNPPEALPHQAERLLALLDGS